MFSDRFRESRVSRGLTGVTGRSFGVGVMPNPNWRKPEVDEGEVSECLLPWPEKIPFLTMLRLCFNVSIHRCKGELEFRRALSLMEEASDEDVVAREEPSAPPSTDPDRRLRRFRRRASECRITCTMRAWLPA